MQQLLDMHDLILMEAAVVERLRRESPVDFHPRLVHADFVSCERGRDALTAIYQGYIDVAREASVPLLLCTPTWRANRERVNESGINPAINSEGVRFMVELRLAQGTAGQGIRIGGVVGCKNDCYRPEEALSTRKSEEFHSWQIDQLSSAGVDFLLASTLPNVDEAVGIARAMSATPTPYMISFVIDRRGRVLDGTPLQDAMSRLDDSVSRQPVGFMFGCSHPSFLNVAQQPAALFERLAGCQANASSRDHAELDGRDQLQVDDVSDWGKEMLALNERYGVKILGGCCGTSVDHLKTLVARHAGLAAG